MNKCEREDSLVDLAKKGNTIAFGELVRHYEKFVYNIALSYTSDPHDAFDVAQDTFVKAFEKIASFKGEASFSTWLYRITANTAKDALDKRKKRWQEEKDIDETPLSDTNSPEREVLDKETGEELKRALLVLDADEREILVLREFEELSYSEIADTLEIELGTVKSRLNRARAKLREIFLNNEEQNRSFSVKINRKK